jgi:amidohydrolase
MKGTVRLLRSDLVEAVVHKIDAILKTITTLYGGTYRFDFNRGYPVLVNDSGFTEFAANVARELFGNEHVINLNIPLMGGEDFAYYLEKVPGTFVRLGSGNEEQATTFPWHHAQFNVDEEVLPYGTALFAQVALSFLESRGNRS